MLRFVPIAFVLCAGCLGLPRQADADGSALSHAADFLDRDDPAGAVPHLVAHLDRTPGQPAIRALLAGQYAALGRWADARREYESAIEEYGDDSDGRVQCHTRLVGIAGELGDERLERRHRGIGLLLIVHGWDNTPGRIDEPTRQRTLGQALDELRTACEADRGDAEAHVYLGDCLTRLRQPAAARAAFAIARAAPPGDLPERASRLLPPLR